MVKKAIVTRGRPAKPIPTTNLIMGAVVKFLQMFMPETLAKRVIVIVLIAIGTPNDRITDATGLSERSIWRLKNLLSGGNLDELFATGYGIGRPEKIKGIENAIVDEIEKNNYHTRQQVADMIFEKFGVSMSVSAVGKLLKKTASGG